jgi:acetyl esterase/lipase
MKIFALAMATGLAMLTSLTFSADAPAKKGGKRAAAAGAWPADLKATDNIVYKKVGDTPLVLAVFAPTVNKFEKAPLVIYIHGGGWGGGDRFRMNKEATLGLIRSLSAAGFVTASIEYRLTKEGAASAMDSAADCKDAVRFLATHAAEYGIDPDRIGTLGTSAGGHLTLVTALGEDADYPGDPVLASTPAKVQCVAAYYPATTFLAEDGVEDRFQQENRGRAMFGGTRAEKPDVPRKLSPMRLLKPTSPPIFLAHGDADKTLSVVHSLKMEAAAKAQGVPVECVISRGAGHGFSGKDIDPNIEEINRRTFDFFVKYLAAE